MREDDENALAGIDLSAWEPPAPPAGLADGVIAKAREAGMPPLVAEGDRPSRPRVPAQRPPRARWWIAGGALMTAAAIAGVVAFATWGIERAPADSSGDVFATTAQTLELAGTTAQLDARSELHWERRGRRIAVAQARGVVTWNVDDKDTLVIDAGAMGASVEASGASLRVEVKMFDRTDVRLMAGSAMVSAAVALVTVAVYAGTVKVTRDGQAVQLHAGATHTIQPAPAPEPVVGGGPREADVDLDDDDLGSVEGLGVGIERHLRRRGVEDDLDLELPPAAHDDLRRKLAQSKPVRTTRPTQSCDEVSCVLNNYDGACCKRYKRTGVRAAPPAAGDLPDSLDRSTIQPGIDAIKSQILACGPYEGMLKVKVEVLPSGRVKTARVDGQPAPSTEMSACVTKLVKTATFARTHAGGSFGYPFMFRAPGAAAPKPPSPSSSSCDPAKRVELAETMLSEGDDALALELLESAQRCKPSPNVQRLALLAACRVPDAEAARRHARGLNAPASLTQICLRNGIDLAPVPATGKLQITSSPAGQVVHVDGKLVGRTPVMMDLPPGKHVVTLISDDKNARISRTVEVRAGEENVVALTSE